MYMKALENKETGAKIEFEVWIKLDYLCISENVFAVHLTTPNCKSVV